MTMAARRMLRALGYAFIIAALHVLRLSAQAPSDVRGMHEAVMKALFKGNLPVSFVVREEFRALPTPSASDWSWLGSGTATLQAKFQTLPVVPGRGVRMSTPAPGTTGNVWNFA